MKARKQRKKQHDAFRQSYIARSGHEFEERVRRALSRNNYVPLDKNMVMKNYSPGRDSAKKREYDLVMFNTGDKQFYVIECKSHLSKDKLVGYEQVSKFNHVAFNYGGRWAKKMIVTDTELSRPAFDYAKEHNMSIITGSELREMENHPKTPYLPFLSGLLLSGLESIIRSSR